MTVSRRILVVDDNADAAESLAALLEIDGHATRVAHGGVEALRIAADFIPELALVDISMPGMDGYQVAAAMRAMPALAAMRLVALSGWGAAADVRRALAAGFDQHLTKPAALDDIEALIAALPPAR